MRTMTAALVALVALLAGCSSDSGGATGGSDRLGGGGGLPSCSEVWNEGQTLPKGYEGCAVGDTVVAPVWVKCKAGGRYTAYEDAMYAVEGQPIMEKAGDVARLYDRCN